MLRVSRVKYLHDYNLQVVFNDGKTKIIDLEDLINEGGYYFEPLKDINKFKNVSLDNMKYSICWPNGADFSPDYLYEHGIEVKKSTKPMPSKRRTKRARTSFSTK